ncbi:MAG: DR2241 family protein [Chthoniobacterales bacterium]
MNDSAPPGPRQDWVADWIAAAPFWIGEIDGERLRDDEFVLCHRDDAHKRELISYSSPDDAAEISRFDDAGRYRPLKTAPNLRRGWRLRLSGIAAVREALDLFYPGRLAAYAAWREERLIATPFRSALERQTGMYRIAVKIGDAAADEVVAGVCRSDGGCLRTILWARDAAGAPASMLLPAQKSEPAFDQTGRGEPALPLLCQEACALLIAETRAAVKRAPTT